MKRWQKLLVIQEREKEVVATRRTTLAYVKTLDKVIITVMIEKKSALDEIGRFYVIDGLDIL